MPQPLSPSIRSGQGGLPCFLLKAPDGAQAEIYL